jgi:hypothetical protein
LGLAQRFQERLRESVGTAVEQAPLRKALAGESHSAHALVATALLRGNESIGFQRPEKSRKIARIEFEAFAESSDVRTVRTDFPQQSCLAEWPVTGEVGVVEHPDALGHRPVEAAYLIYELRHDL